MDIDLAEGLTQQIDKLVAEIAPEAGRRGMYGGIMFELELGVPRTAICGHFVYKDHVSLEFSHGVHLSDPNGVLEGGGKHRRHIKLRDSNDLEVKAVRRFLELAFVQGVPT